MNILLLSQFMSTTRGGGEHIFSLMAKILGESGHNVWVITNRIIGEEYPQYKNVKIIFVPPTLEHKGGLPPSLRNNLLYFFYGMKSGFSIIKQEKISVIHSNNFSPALTGSFLSFFTSVPHVTTIHDVFSLYKNFWKNWARQQDISKINVILAPFFERLMIRIKSSAIHTVSETSKDDLIKFGTKKKIFVIPNSIIPFEISSNKVDPLQFIFVGRLVFYKNVEVIIRCISIMRQKFPKIKLLIIGDGPHKTKLVELVSLLNLHSNVIFLGYVSEIRKRQLISSSNALLFPSLYEGFGMVILEAFCCKRPAVVANVRPLSDIVSHKKTGFVVDAENPKSWAETLYWILENNDESNSIGIAGEKELYKKYSVSTILQNLNDMYSKVS